MCEEDIHFSLLLDCEITGLQTIISNIFPNFVIDVGTHHLSIYMCTLLIE